MSDNKTFFDRLFPDTDIKLTVGEVQESGTGHTTAEGKFTRERWVKVNGIVFIGADENLYQSSYGHHVAIAYDDKHRVIGYWNRNSGMSSEPSKSSVIGSFALMVLLTAVAYFGGIWNFIWKGFDIWWLTIIIITFYSLYALVWTPMYAMKEWQRETRAQKLISAEKAKG